MDISTFVAAQREAVENDRDRERYRDRERRSDRERDRSREHRHRRERSGRRERRDDDSRRDSRNRYRDEDSREYREEYEEEISDSYTYNNDYDSRKLDQNNYGSYDKPRYDGNYQGGRPRGESRAADKWISDNVTNTVLVKGLPPHIEEQDIRAELMMSSTPIREVRLVKDKTTGASRGFAFVEFHNVSDAQLWMEQNQGEMHLLNQYTCSLYYSTPKSENRNTSGGSLNGNVNNLQSQNSGHGHNPPIMGGVIGDWICSKCGVHNFKRREHCFKCNISREESDRGKESDGYDQVGHNPCNTLILRGLDLLTSEESLNAALQKVTILPLKSLQVIRDESGKSLSFAFLELESIVHSNQLLDTINRLQFPFEVDGKAVMVNFAKNTFTTVMATMGQQWSSGQQGQYAYNSADYASYEQYYNSEAYQQYYSEYYQQSADPNSTDSTNAAAAVAQAAIQQAQAAKAYQQQNEQPQVTTTESSQEYPQYPTPDVSTYQYEETSGYYYDPQTGLYYDANTQYYYNATTGEFMYWDGERNTYLPAPSDETADMQRPTDLGEDDRKEGKGEKKDKVKVAKKIAKDMAKWAKSMNQSKEPSRRINISTSQMTTQRKETASADAGFAMFEKTGKTELHKLNEPESSMMPPPPLKSNATPTRSAKTQGGGDSASGLVASYGDGDDSDPEDDDGDENKLVDLAKMACLLCKRQFPSKDALQRHQQLSDLHKKNLAELRASKGTASVVRSPVGGADQGSPAGGMMANVPPMAMGQGGPLQYRDRAKERREKYGAPAPPDVSARNKMPAQPPPVPFEQPTKMGLGSDNVGNKLLKKMGWSAGRGLGKSQQGIVDPLMASRRQAGAGLGSQGSKITVDPQVATDYRQAAKQQLFARYRELE